jgi:hypothetical protein
MDGLNYNLLIGCGIASDISFENDFLEKYKNQNIKCIALDGTINDLPDCKHRNKMEFFKKNIDGNNIKNLLNSSDKIFLKMDIEGSEYKFFEEITANEINNISQMVIEFHSTHENIAGSWDERKKNCFKKILKTHDLIHLHSNNYAPLIDNQIIPQTIELTYVHKKYIKNDYKLNNKPLPTHLDNPNNPNIPDHILKGFPYQRNN